MPIGNPSRRDLLRLGAGLPFVLGLSGAVPACGVPPTLDVDASSGVVVLPLDELERLADGEPAVYLAGPGLGGPVLLWRDGTNTYRALSATCTHLHCQVRPGEGIVQCPCHGSVFALDGSVLRGPAQRPLQALPAWVDGAALHVDVSALGGRP